MRRECKGRGEGCVWLLFAKPNTGGDKRYENNRQKSARQRHGRRKSLNWYQFRNVKMVLTAVTPSLSDQTSVDFWSLWGGLTAVGTVLHY